MKNNNDNKREKLTLYKGHDGLGIFYCLKLGSSNTNENKDERENGGTSERVLRKREKKLIPFLQKKKKNSCSRARQGGLNKIWAFLHPQIVRTNILSGPLSY